jgi:predicted MFS family arabinose efflux permease
MIGASFAVGFTLGPPIGGLLARAGHGVPMLVAAGMAAVNFVWAAFELREPARRAERPVASMTGRLDVLRNPALARLCFVYFLFSVAVTQLETTFAFLMSHRFGYDELGVGLVMLAMAIVIGGIQGGAMKRLAARFHERRLILAGLVLMAMAFFSVPLPNSVAILMAPLAIAAVGRGISQPPMMSLISQIADVGSRGIVMGVFQSCASAARVVGPLVAGALYDMDQAFPYWLAAALLVIATLTAIQIRDRPPTASASAA